MDKKEMLALLKAVQQGETSPEDALLQLKLEPFEDIGYAKIDHHRGIRQGAIEVIYGAGKTTQQIIGIVEHMVQSGRQDILVTRIRPESAHRLQEMFHAEYHEIANICIVNGRRSARL